MPKMRSVLFGVAAPILICAVTACTPAAEGGPGTSPGSSRVEECRPAGQASETPPEPVENYDGQAESAC